MKKVFTLLFIITAFVSDAAVYYCSPTGNDNNTGTIGSPWFSLNRAWQAVNPGDTIYLRGGTYAYTAQIQGYVVGKNGTASNRIVIANYPGENPTITRTAAYQNNVQHWRGGVYFSGDYVHWKGISFTGFKHIGSESSPFIWRGFYSEDANFNIFELLKSYSNELGISLQGNSRGNLVKNCDAWYNYDAGTGGGNSDGMGTNYITVTDPANPNVFRGCRVWWNGDDGFDGWTGTETGGVTIFDSCWAWNNGYFYGTFNPAGNGEGFKGGGGGSANPGTFQRIYQNCMAFYNKHDGFNQNNLNARVKVYNCIAYKNAVTGINFSENNNLHEWRNNVSFDNVGCQAYITAESIISNNSFGLGTSPNGICGPGAGMPWNNNVTATDFVSVDTTGVAGPRQADGSLPNLNFMKLNAASDLIDAGINVGLPYTGTAPDRGAFETGGAAPPPNQSPTADAGTDKNITLPVNTITQVGGGSDPDGIISSFQWTKIAGPNTYTIVSPGTSTTVINNLVAGVYQFQLTVTDNAGATDRDTMVVTVNAATNQAPTANAGPDRNLTLPTNSFTQTGSGTDPDGTISAYQWTKIAGPTQFTIVSPTQAQTIINNLVQGTYQFELRVTDNAGAFGRDTMTVTVNPAPNQAPTANAGPDRNLTLPTNSFTQTGSGSDPDGSISAYQWTKIAGPAQYVIISPLLPQTVINNLVQGTYQFELMVTDNQGATGRDTMTVIINAAPPNQAPTANAGPDRTLTLPSNSFTQIGSGSDPDGTISAYQWTKIAGPTQFTIVSPTQAQTVINNLVQGVYQFELRVTDNAGAFGRDTMTVTVNAAPNQPPTANAGTDKNITLPTNSITQTGSGSDPDGTIASYQWNKIAGPAQFAIVSPTQAQTVINNLVQGTYQFELVVTDNQGATGRDTMVVIVNAVPTNQSPIANAGADQSITLPVNSITQTGSGTDPDGTITSYQWTKVSGPATYNIVSPTQAQTVINNLVQGTYRFELMVTDNQGSTDTDTMTVVVNPAAVPNQAPIANAGPDRTLTLPVNSFTQTGSGTDPDGTITGYQWNKISGPATYTIVSPTQAQTVINNLVQGTYQFELVVTDNLGATGRDTMSVTVNAVPNQLPVANAGTDKNITLPVNSITQTGSGTDPDGTITAYQWTRVSGPATYTIVSPTQAQTVINNLVQGAYQFELMVTDNLGATDRDTMIVVVNPASTVPNLPPTANAGPDTTITLPVNVVIISGSGTDPDGTIASYSWAKISGPAQYTIVFPTQAQTAFSDLVQGTYQFELTVTDNLGATARDTVTVTVEQNQSRASTATIYPNPATSTINVRIEAVTYANKTQIQIISVTGVVLYNTEIMRTQQLMTIPIDVSRLPAGSYFLKLSLDINNVRTLPFIKQ